MWKAIKAFFTKPARYKLVDKETGEDWGRDFTYTEAIALSSRFGSKHEVVEQED